VGDPVATSVLSDGTIRRLVDSGRIMIKPFDATLVQPASIDLRLGDSFRVFHNHRVTAIDLREVPTNLTEEVKPASDEPFVIHPGEFCLGRTLEWVELPDDLVARVEGKSSLGRLGLIVHATAGFVDPGWHGHLTLELSNVTKFPILIYPGMKVVQINFMRMSSPVLKPYGSAGLHSKYQGESGPMASRYYQEFQRGRAMAAALRQQPVAPNGRAAR
jgi:dCTP deaminase